MPKGGRRHIMVIPCGKAKQPYACPAGEMYLGAYHRLCREYALTLVNREAVFILSSKYGLLTMNQVIDPYDLRMGQRGGIGVEEVYEQAVLMGLLGCQVTALGGERYTTICRSIWGDNCVTPLNGVGGIGKQLQWLRDQCQRVLTGKE